MEVFGFLRVLHLERVQDRHGYWLCKCERPKVNGKACGRRRTVRDSKLREGRIVSCGCAKADPEVRRAAWQQVPKRKRIRIAKNAAKASVKVRRRLSVE